MKEIEVLSSISKDEFFKKAEEFGKKIGKPKIQKRLGIILSSYEKGNRIDTRIKITNGRIHLVQKIGEGIEAERSNEEIDMTLDLSADELLKLIRILQNFGKDIPGFTSPLQQYDNLIFETEEFEIKLYRQFNGDNKFYGFEVELLQEDLDIDEICKSLDLQLDGIERDADYWTQYDYKFNQNSLELDDQVLLDIISNYV